MSQARLPEHRHWVQIEMTPTGSVTGFRHFDLNMVDGVSALRNTEGEVERLLISYAGELKLIAIEGAPAKNFWKVWSKFVELHHVDEQAKLGVILTAPGQIHFK